MVDAGFPQAPDEERLTVEKAVLDASGKLEVSAYTSLKDHFAGEAPKEEHPVPSKPGTKANEQEDLKLMTWWSDARGAGWKVTHSKSQVKYFSLGKWGSWRLAFLLARLQREVWAKRPVAAQEVQEGTDTPKNAKIRCNMPPIATAPPASKKSKRGQPKQPQAETESADAGAPPTETGEGQEQAPGKKRRKASADASLSTPVGGSTGLPETQLPEKSLSPPEADGLDSSWMDASCIASSPNDLAQLQKDKDKKSRPGAATALKKKQDAPATSSKPVTFTGFPSEAGESRLTVEGAVVVDGGKLDVNEYLKLRGHFADEAPKELHPVYLKPGVKVEEQDQTENLRWWSDAKGEGWIAKGPTMGALTKDKWFNVKTCGSWRLAFLMARLQRDVWLSGMHIESSIDNL